MTAAEEDDDDDAARQSRPGPSNPHVDPDPEPGVALVEEADELSPEDAAWVDSCLVKNPGEEEGGEEEEMEDDRWGDLRDALLDALCSPSPAATAAAVGESSSSPSPATLSAREVLYGGGEPSATPAAPGGATTFGWGQQVAAHLDTDEIPREEYGGGVMEEEGAAGTVTSSNPIRGEEFLASDADLLAEEEEFLSSDLLAEEGEREFRGYDAVADATAPDGSLAENIFRVWDLNIQEGGEDDEDELGSQLKRALEGGPLGALPPTGPSTAALDDVDELVAGIADLSLRTSAA